MPIYRRALRTALATIITTIIYSPYAS